MSKEDLTSVRDTESARALGKLGGRPKGSRGFKYVINKILDDEITIQEGTKQLKMTKRDALAVKLAKIALSDTSKENDVLRAMDMIMDRMDGKPRQSIEQTTTNLDGSVEDEISKKLDDLTDEQFAIIKDVFGIDSKGSKSKPQNTKC